MSDNERLTPSEARKKLEELLDIQIAEWLNLKVLADTITLRNSITHKNSCMAFCRARQIARTLGHLK